MAGTKAIAARWSGLIRVRSVIALASTVSVGSIADAVHRLNT